MILLLTYSDDVVHFCIGDSPSATLSDTEDIAVLVDSQGEPRGGACLLFMASINDKPTSNLQTRSQK